MSERPQFASRPHVGLAQLTAANPNRDGTGALVSAFTAPAGGSRVDTFNLKAVGAVTAGVVRCYLKLTGGTARLLLEVPVKAMPATTSAATFEQVVDLLGGLNLPEGAELLFSTEKAETINAFVFGGDFA